MMRLDLESARAKWIEEARGDQAEREKREESDYLCYQDEDGLYADFHANRHIFITNLSKAGIGPNMAQTLARHSNVDLTMNTYTHLEMNDRAMAINGLPAPLMLGPIKPAEFKPPEKFAHMFAKLPASDGIDCQLPSQEDQIDVAESADAKTKKPLSGQGFVTPCHPVATGDESSGGGIRTPDTRIMIPLVNPENTEKNVSSENLAACGAATETQNASIAPGLRVIIDRWDELPETAKEEMLVIVRAAGFRP